MSLGHSYVTIAKEIFGSASNRRRLGLALALFFFHKGTGTDAINYFAPEIFKSIGVVGNSSTLLTTGIYGIVKLAATLIYVLFIIDRVGRRVPLLVGATIQATAMLVLGLFVGIADPVNNPNGKGVHGGGIFAIIAIYMYAVGWAMGHSIACYVVAAEIFPSRIRAVCMALCLFENWYVLASSRKSLCPKSTKANSTQDDRLRHHESHTLDASQDVVRYIPLLRYLDIYRCGVHLLLSAGTEGSIDRVDG